MEQLDKLFKETLGKMLDETVELRAEVEATKGPPSKLVQIRNISPEWLDRLQEIDQQLQEMKTFCEACQKQVKSALQSANKEHDPNL